MFDDGVNTLKGEKHMTNKELIEQLNALKAENEALKAKKTSGSGPSCKVTEKGGVSFYGVGRFPVTLYKEQWLKLITNFEMIAKFIADHDAELSIKPAKVVKPDLKIVA